MVISPSLESAFTALFKYPPRVFQRGDFVLAPVVPKLVVVILALLALGLVITMYARVRAVRLSDRIVLGVLRALAVFVVLACLLRPTMVLSSAVPQRNVLAVLFDDSRSMRLHDVNGSSRLAAMQRVFADTGSLMKALSSRFAIRAFRFSADATPASGASSATGGGARTDLANALDVTREDLSGMPLAGVIVVTDGADNGGGDLGSALLGLRARRVPVYTVGVGQERFTRDLAIEHVTVPQSVLSGSSMLLDVSVGVRGAGGEQATVTVEANGRVVGSEDITVPKNTDMARARVRVAPLPPGTYRLAVRVKPLAGETVTENNEYHAILTVRPGPERILYVEGEPRPEFAFLRRAMADDSSLQVVGLLRSADRKYLRLGVNDSLELISGFPVKREELFRYRAIILGSIESGFFSGDQLRMLAEFVSVRGGSLLALGGRDALSEGGYADTPVAEVLPVTLGREGRDTSVLPLELAVHPTAAGLSHAALQLRPTDAANAARWDSLPPLTSVNTLGPLRAGSTVLLEGRVVGQGSRLELPVLAFQRYGRGIGAVFGVQDSWLWRMDARMAVDDATHATFWRQLLRWMVEETPDQVDVAALPSRVGPGEPVAVRAHVADSTFQPVNGGTVTTRVTAPDGKAFDVPMEWSLREDGSYTGHFVAQDSGAYSLTASVITAHDTLRSAPAALLSDQQGADVEQAEQRASLLEHVSTETGGRYYPIAGAGKLADDVVFTEAGVTVRDSHDLWDMPIVFIVLALLLGAEWVYRRRRGLA